MSEKDSKAVAWQWREDEALNGEYSDWRPCSREEYEVRLAILAGRESARMAGSFGCEQNPLREDRHGWPVQVRALCVVQPAATYSDKDVLDEVRAMVKLCFASQAEFAKSRNVSPAYVSDVLNGRRAMPEQWAVLSGFSRPKWFRDTPKRWIDVDRPPTK